MRSEGGPILRDFKELRRKQRVWVHFPRNTRVLAQVSPTAHNVWLLACPAGPPMRSMSKWVLIAPTVTATPETAPDTCSLRSCASSRGHRANLHCDNRRKIHRFPADGERSRGRQALPRDLVKRSLPLPRRRTERTPPPAPHWRLYEACAWPEYRRGDSRKLLVPLGWRPPFDAQCPFPEGSQRLDVAPLVENSVDLIKSEVTLGIIVVRKAV